MNMVSSPPSGAVPLTMSTPAAGEDRLSLIRHYLRLAFRRRYLLGGFVAGFVLLGLIITLLMTPKYTAEMTIEISRESDKITNFQGVNRDASIADQEFYQTQYGLLQSRTLAERVAAQLKLVDNPEFFEQFGVSSNDPAFQVTNGRYPASGRGARQRAAGGILLKHIDVSPTRLSRLVTIRFTSPDAELSAKVANAWAENFIQTNLERRIQATSYGRTLLQNQLAEYKRRLDESQRQLVAYASAQQIINLPAQGSGERQSGSERSIVADDLAAINTALAQATADRIQLEARFRQAGASS